MNSPGSSKKTKVVATHPHFFILQVTKPSGAPIVGADVEIEWEDDQNPYHKLKKIEKAKTGPKGKVTIPVLDPKNWLTVDKNNGTRCTIRVSKEFHGPVVPYGTDFTYGPASVDFKYKPGQSQSSVELIGLTPVEEVLWGRPRTVGKKQEILHVTLVEGGELGKEHLNIRTRRLSAPHRPENPPKSVSQIDEELLFHIAHGGLALDKRTDFKFKIEEVTQPDSSIKKREIKLDLPPPPTGSPPTVPKLTVRNAIMGGLRIMHIADFRFNSQKVLISGLADTHSLNPRLVVGTVRLGRILAGLGVRTMITVGFNRAGEPDKYHGPGRAVDFSGALMEHSIPLKDPEHPNNRDLKDPHLSKKIFRPWKDVTINGSEITVFERTCEPEKDLIVYFHWGKVQLQVKNTTNTTRRNEDNKHYKNRDNTSENEELLYRLSPIPATTERNPKHPMTDDHYSLASDLFLEVYRFFTREFSHRDAFLGPLDARSVTSVPSVPLTPAQLADAIADDTGASGAAPMEPGVFPGFVLHPDYPKPDSLPAHLGGSGARRETHNNHVHANVGGKLGEGDFER